MTSYRPHTPTPWLEPGHVLHAWVVSMRAASLAERTVLERPRIIARAAEELGCDVTELDGDDLEAWLAGLRRLDGTGPASPGTRATYFGALRAWHAWLVRTGRRPDDPTQRMRTPKVPRRRPRPVADGAIEQLLATTMRRRTRVMVHLALYQGLRAHEIATVRGEDIDPYAATITVHGKGGVTETVPMHQVVAQDAATMPRRGWWFPGPNGHVRRDSVSARLSAVFDRAGLTYTGHQLRHTFGTNLVRDGADIRVVQTLMRHASLATTAQYVGVDDDQQRDALARLRVHRELRRA